MRIARQLNYILINNNKYSEEARLILDSMKGEKNEVKENECGMYYISGITNCGIRLIH